MSLKNLKSIFSGNKFSSHGGVSEQVKQGHYHAAGGGSFGDDIGFDDFEPDSMMDKYKKMQQGNQTKGFADDLGFDNFDPDSNGRNLRQQQGNQTRGFGDDLGFDEFIPDSQNIRIKGQNQTTGFGGDLGINIFDPEGSGILPIAQNQQNQISFGDDIGYDDFDPDKMQPTPEKPTPNIPRGFGDDIGYDDIDPERRGGFGDDIGFDDIDPERRFGDDLGLDDFDPDYRITDDLGFDDFNPDKMQPTPEKPVPDIPKQYGDDIGYDDFEPERLGSINKNVSPPNPVGFGDDIGFDDFDPERRGGFGDDIGFDDFDPDKMQPTPEKPTPNIPKGFGDDIGFDDFEPERIEGYDKVGPGGNPIGFGDDIGYDDFDPESSIIGYDKIKNRIPMNAGSVHIVEDNGNKHSSDHLSELSVGDDIIPFNFGDDLGFDDFSPDNLPDYDKVGTLSPLLLKTIYDNEGTQLYSVGNSRLTQPVDFMGGTNSYYPFIENFVPGFNFNFSLGGYAFGVGEVGNSKFINILTGTHTQYGGTLEWPGAVNFFDDTNSFGFTLSGVNNPFVTKYQDVNLETLTFNKSDSILSYDTHNVNNITFNSQIEEGVNFIDTIHASGFTPNLSSVSDTQFLNVDGFSLDSNAEEMTTTYYDSIHNRNVITDNFGGPVNFLSDEGASGFTLSGGDDLFTTQFEGVTNTEFTKPVGLLFDTHDVQISNDTTITFETQTSEGVNFIDTLENHSLGFTPGLTSNDYLDSKFVGTNESESLYDSTTDYHGGYAINIDNIDTNFAGNLFVKSEDGIGEFGSTNVGQKLYQNKIVTLQSGQKVTFTHNQYSVLYNNNQTVKDAKFTGNTSKYMMSLQSNGDPSHPSQGPGGNLFGFSRGAEPYVISDINDSGYGDRIVPIKAADDDSDRLLKFATSPTGIAFIAKENALGFGVFASQTNLMGRELTHSEQGNKYQPKVYDPSSLTSAISEFGLNIRLRRDEASGGLFGILSSLAAEFLSDEVGASYADQDGSGVFSSDDNSILGTKLDVVTPSENVSQNQNKSMSPFKIDNLQDSSVNYNNYLWSITDDSNPKKGGDNLTLMDTNVVQYDNQGNATSITDWDETRGDEQAEQASERMHGMPLYFRDLRDERVLIFRAYITGLSETVGPNWSSETYIGRSEPVYIYSPGTEREINFSLTLFAQNEIELLAIYEKINRLTSMCYPEYKKAESKLFMTDPDGGSPEMLSFNIGSVGEKVRMKPPFLKFRLGELFGSGPKKSKEVTGFLKSLSYTYPDEGVWETKKGYRVPKLVTAEIGFQVVHDHTPSLDFAQAVDGAQDSFYGINLNKAPFSNS